MPPRGSVVLVYELRMMWWWLRHPHSSFLQIVPKRWRTSNRYAVGPLDPAGSPRGSQMQEGWMQASVRVCFPGVSVWTLVHVFHWGVPQLCESVWLCVLSVLFSMARNFEKFHFWTVCYCNFININFVELMTETRLTLRYKERCWLHMSMHSSWCLWKILSSPGPSPSALFLRST